MKHYLQNSTRTNWLLVMAFWKFSLVRTNTPSSNLISSSQKTDGNATKIKQKAEIKFILKF